MQLHPDQPHTPCYSTSDHTPNHYGGGSADLNDSSAPNPKCFSSLPCVLAQKPEEGSISHRVQRLTKYRFLKKQSDLLLNADDLDAMWVCLRENCVINDSTAAEKVLYHVATLLPSLLLEHLYHHFDPRVQVPITLYW